MSEAQHIYRPEDGSLCVIPDHSAWRRLDGHAPASLDPRAGCGKGDEQGTPIWLYELLHAEFGFDCDMFSSHENALCSTYHTIDRPWDATSPGSVLWSNPPYSRGAITAAMAAVREAALQGETVVTLTRLEPGADWWKPIDELAQEVRLLDVRLKFRGQTDSYNFPCAIGVFRGQRRAPWPHYYPWHVRKHRPRGAI